MAEQTKWQKPAVPVKSMTKIVNSMKRVREEILRWEYDCVAHNLNAGVEAEMYTYGGSPGDRHTVRLGEAEELLTLGIEPAFNVVTPTNYYVDQLRLTDRDGSEWNKFLTIPALTRMNANQLAFNDPLNFERQQMSWGYRSFLSSPKDLAATWKIPEGDQYRLHLRASNTNTIVAGTNRTYAVVRRYMSGSDVDYKHFDQYDGGLKSNKRYYNDVQSLATTVANQPAQAWSLTIIRNEAYKFFAGGILPDVNLAAATMASHLLEAQIKIDDPMTLYNSYFVNHNYNCLPFKNSSHVYSDGSVATPWAWQLEKMHRFAPTIDILKNRNKNLVVYVYDDGTPAANIYTAMVGIKYQV